MSKKLQSIIEVPEYTKQIADLINEESQKELINHIAFNPLDGNLIIGAGGARKIRWKYSQTQGKSGGIRVIYFYHSIEIPIFLLTAYKKSRQENISQKAKNELRKQLPKIVEMYKKG